MANELSTKIVNLDLDIILQNYNKPNFWEKEWLIYKSELFSLYFKIKSISIESRIIECAIFCKNNYIKCKKLKKNVYIGDWLKQTYVKIPIKHSDYSKEKFKNDLIVNCIKIIENIENTMIKHYAEYETAEKLEENFRNELKRIAEEFLDENNVSNSDIRDAYIYSYVNNYNIPSYTSEILSNYKYTVIPNEYLMLCSFFDDKKRYDEISQKMPKIRKSTKIKIWLENKKLDNDEYVDEMKSYLESI